MSCNFIMLNSQSENSREKLYDFAFYKKVKYEMQPN